MIPVTKPFMPPREEYNRYLDGIWEREYLTNNGPLVQQLESGLKDYLGAEHLLYVSNGTIALQIAIKALDLEGEIITTPFSYVATTSSIVWEGCKPVFVDIDPDTLNINPALIEGAVTHNTSAILATHVFGNPCDIDQIQKIADRHGLKVIYDAAHCFGTKYKGQSVFNYGDISTTSFHATKLFHTIEGGAVFTNNRDLADRVRFMRNFGHDGPEKFNGVGINGKNSEFHAAMGLCNLNYIEEILENRKNQVFYYNKLFMNQPLNTLTVQKDSEWNYAYYPVIFKEESTVLKAIDKLVKNRISPRRYFFPSLDTLDYVKTEDILISRNISERVLCLPLYAGLKRKTQFRVCEVLNETF